jgi:hypothetical protein
MRFGLVDINGSHGLSLISLVLFSRFGKWLQIRGTGVVAEKRPVPDVFLTVLRA